MFKIKSEENKLALIKHKTDKMYEGNMLLQALKFKRQGSKLMDNQDEYNEEDAEKAY